MNTDALNIAVQYIEAHLYEKFSVEAISKRTNYSVRQLNRMFRQAFNCNLSTYIRSKKINAVLFEMITKNKSVGFAADRIQIDISSFSRIVQRKYGCSPKNFNEKHLNLLTENEESLSQGHVQDLLEITNGLAGLSKQGAFKYKFATDKQSIVMSNLNYMWLYKHLRSMPPIPLPSSFIDLLGSECSETITALVSLAYYELDRNNYDITKMKWNPEEWQKTASCLNERFDKMCSQIMLFYNLNNPEIDKENNLLWYFPKTEWIKNLSEGINAQLTNKRPFSYSVNKEDFLEFIEAANKSNLVKFYRSTDETDVTMGFDAKKLLKIIKIIGEEIKFPNAFVKSFDQNETIIFLIGLNKEIIASLANNEIFTKTSDALAINFFIITNFFDIDKPKKVKNYFVYTISRFVLDVLNSLIELQDNKLATIPFSFTVSQENETIRLTLTEPFKTLYIEEIACP